MGRLGCAMTSRMSRRACLVLACGALLAACGGNAATPSAVQDAGPAADAAVFEPSDAGSQVDGTVDSGADGGLGEDFAARVAQVVHDAQQSGNTNCATALPSIPVSDAAAMREAIQQFVARIVGPVDSVSYNATACGGIGRADCATQFQHMLFKADGQLGTALLPLAREVGASGKCRRCLSDVAHRWHLEVRLGLDCRHPGRAPRRDRLVRGSTDLPVGGALPPAVL